VSREQADEFLDGVDDDGEGAGGLRREAEERQISRRTRYMYQQGEKTHVERYNPNDALVFCGSLEFLVSAQLRHVEAMRRRQLSVLESAQMV
jgi:hypothetical protein